MLKVQISHSNKLLIALAALLTLGTAFAEAGASSGMLAYRLLTDGILAVAWLLAMTGVGWGFVRRFSVPPLLRLVTAAAIGIGIVSLLLLAAGLIGWLNAATAWAILLIGLGLGAGWIWAGRKSLSPPVSATPWQWLWLLLMPFLGLAIVGAVAPPGLLWQDEPAGYDVTEYHLQVPREWYEAGKITGLHHNVFSYMPMNVEMHDLLAMHLRGGPWAGMYLAQFIHLAIMILAVLAAAGMAGALSDKPWAGALAGVMMGAVPWITSLAPIAYNEGGLMLFGGLAVGWILLAGDWRGWLIAGVLAGFACGVKLTAAPMVVGAVVFAWFIVCMVRAIQRAPQAKRLNLRGMGIFVFASILTFAPWMLRNLVWVKNPVFPEAMEVLGKAHFSDVQVERWRLAHSPKAGETKLGERLAIGWQRIIVDWRYGFVFLALVVVAIALRRDWRSGFVALVILLQLIVWLGFTHLQGRFFILVIPLGAVLIGMVQFPPWRWIASGGVLGVAVIGFVVLSGRYNKLLSKPAENGALGVENLTWMIPVPTEIDVEKLPADRAIILVGDAQAFFYSGIPMTRLHYQTVFDVAGNDGQDWLSKWTLGERGTVLVFPGELFRFKKSYHSVPAPNIPELEGRAPYILNR